MKRLGRPFSGGLHIFNSRDPSLQVNLRRKIYGDTIEWWRYTQVVLVPSIQSPRLRGPTSPAISLITRATPP